MDHYDRLRELRRQHMMNARWWKTRYRTWGADLARQWFMAEVRSHRLCSRYLWQNGVN